MITVLAILSVLNVCAKTKILCNDYKENCAGFVTNLFYMTYT